MAGCAPCFIPGKMQKQEPKDDLEVDAIAEQELSRLQRHYRIMEGDKESFSEEAKFFLNKQRKVIESLLSERNELITNLNVAASKRIESKEAKQNDSLAFLMEVQSRFQEAIRTEKTQLHELEHQIRKVEKEVAALRKDDVTDHKLIEQAVAREKSVNLLENRLHNATVKFNKQLAHNAALREEIDHLLKERAQFNVLYEALVSKLNQGKKIMIDLIEQATHAYDQREESQTKLSVLKERGRQDLIAQSAEMRELQRRFDHDTKLQEFLAVKGQHRVLVDLEAKEALKKKQQREATERLIQQYQAILEQIKEFSGESDIDRLSAQFLKQEEENFALFNYVNELNNELESLQEQVSELRASRDEQDVTNRQREQQQQDKLHGLRRELEGLTAEADDAQRRLDGWTELRNRVLRGIEALFHLVKCDNSPLLELLGGNTNVTPYNLLLYLEMIERRCVEMVNRCYFLEKATEDKGSLPAGGPVVFGDVKPIVKALPTVEAIVEAHPCPLCVEQEEISAIGDAIVTPLTRDEVRKQLIYKIQNPDLDMEDRLHTISHCRLPRSRRLMQKRLNET
ncbi:outer dynein arm-docking complex subunit 1 isoform X1 [Frankliniella occidentalis]|uniref:Outer dynein arm-docking complex subunit 1 isoform X1 n=2 Tax=Frankliniella occidentalis TaxID=133901 RepID=A0A6J1SE97_FRAOC|nr:outer dynein arm-docking complex subunit 1 isoform X1 [Frankliniella occidentalis]